MTTPGDIPARLQRGTSKLVDLLQKLGQVNGTDHTLEEVGQSFAVTRERIRQIEAKTLAKLRYPARSRKLRPFLYAHGDD